MRVVFPTKMSSSLVMAKPGPGRTCSAPAGASTARARRAACRILPGARRFGARHPEPEKDHFRDKEGGGRSGEGRGVAPPPGGRGNPRLLVPAPGPHPHPYPGPVCRKTSGVEANGQCPCAGNLPPHFFLAFLPLSLPFSGPPILTCILNVGVSQVSVLNLFLQKICLT